MNKINPDYYAGNITHTPVNPFKTETQIKKMQEQQKMRRMKQFRDAYQTCKNSDCAKSSYLGNNNLLLSIDTPAPVNYDMGKGVYGSYDDIRLVANPYNGWKAQPANVPLLKSDYLFVPQGTPLPLKNEMIYSQIPKDSMFVFAHNQSSPICTGTYSTSTGGVCTSAEQQYYIGATRGNNKNYLTDF